MTLKIDSSVWAFLDKEIDKCFEQLKGAVGHDWSQVDVDATLDRVVKPHLMDIIKRLFAVMAYTPPASPVSQGEPAGSAKAEIIQTKRGVVTESCNPMTDVNDMLRIKLREILSLHGRSIMAEPSRLRALLMDACPSQNPEIRILMDALQLGIAADLTDPASLSSPDVVLPRWTRRIRFELRRSDEDSKWAVNTWAIALGVIA